MPKKIISKSPLELRYEKTDPKPQFPLETYRMILGVGLKEGTYPTLWRDRKPNIQQFMRTLHPTCEMCGKDSSGGSLDVHHLKWSAKHDCRYENLFVICRSCHSTIHRRGGGWYPSQPWLAEWGEVPDGLISRGHLDKDGNIAGMWLKMPQNINQMIDNNSTDTKLTNDSERKSKTPKRSRKAAAVST
jgi:hypothetical protein